MRSRGMYRGVEDPIQGVFNLADEISNRSDGILFRSVFATVFVYFGLFVMFLLFLTSLIQGLWFIALVLLTMMVTGFITLRLLKGLRDFLRKVNFRYSAILAMREGPPVHELPKGKGPAERFMNYLKEANPAFRKLSKDRPELIHKDAHLVGRSGKRYHFDVHVMAPPSLRFRILGRGYGGYALFVKEYGMIPGKKDVDDLVEALADIHKVTKVLPRRVVMVFKAPSSYKGLPDDAYEMLVQGVPSPMRKGDMLNVQAVAEVGGKYYDFVPFIPELRNMLP